MEAWELAEGERYTDYQSVRLVEKIDNSNDVVKYIENPRGGHVFGLCSIQSFCDWAKKCYTSEQEIWEKQ
ncbi:hypothetical protein [Brevibacillus porteri]|uniref:hypothetical protein n=1 Tax=Brevibacillus porteri TaxID=2126350 RepID=UPI003636552B